MHILKILTCTLRYSLPSSCYWIRFTHSRSKKLAFIFISVAGLAWWYLNIYHTCDESKITAGTVDSPGETKQTVPSVMSIATLTCVRPLNYKKITKIVFASTGINSDLKIWRQNILSWKLLFCYFSVFIFIVFRKT